MKRLTLLIIILALLISCQKNQDSQTKIEPKYAEPKFQRDLATIKKTDTLKAITVYSGTSYFLYRGQAMGFEYELLQQLAEYLDVELKIIIAHDLNELISMLNKGQGDIIAHGITITNQRKRYISFTDYLYLTNQVLVQRKPEGWRKMTLEKIQKEVASDPIHLIDDTVSVRLNSAYYHRIQNLEEEIGGEIHIDTVAGTVPTGKLIRKVIQGELEYTMADNNIAEINSSYYPSLHVQTDMSFSQRIAWGVRKNSPELLQAVNEWITKMKKKVDYYVIYNKYFKNKHSFRARIKSEFYSRNSNKISQYDPLIKQYSENINWDWRFVSSIIYQESQFNPKARSWARARGLMQIMPRTAKELKVTNLTDPQQNIRGGTQYLNKLWKRWKSIPDSVQRLKFTLASYNCGYYHVVDAQNLTKKYGENPQKWDNNVENYLLKLAYPKFYNDKVVNYGYARGIEPVTYVKQIFKRYEHYKKFIEL